MKEEERKRRRAIRQNLQDNNRIQFLALLPVSESEIKTLFTYLDENLEACNDTLRQVIAFIRERNLPEKELIFRLNENGGFCDCEVLANVEDHYNQVLGVK